MDETLISMCAEYVALVDAMRTGCYAAGALHQLDRDRQILHTQLLAATGLSRHDDMYRYARNLLHVARATRR
ncbi:MAG TPA: hypothetical protein DEF43_08380 [Chloroflexus aurantiacus]|jgi:hypothetical protein|uniref:hypothetical protein n=1 Tax=Chloroflexus TaxID=1107 RepID=UPI000173CAF8|nr:MULTISPECIES: hypothetical protein [Chloroflexus]GIV89882.1 MAG: hypothetical protein KatS3mg055_2400 [Chloroflexus sp.]HBW67163.1 hypothetical protein [Chloroflexus aurantiacus]